MLFLAAAGCDSKIDNDAGPSPGTPGAAADASPHAHPTVGPHHGTLVELGSEEYHAEVTHDATSVTIYVLDSSAQQAVPIEASEVTINVVRDGQPQQFQLVANPDSGDPAGSSSRFTLEDSVLASHLDDESAAPKLSLTIQGTPYRGDIKHEHAHEHDHAHDDHSQGL